jgi:N-acetylmuramic acid 6-phosphate etherase
MVALDKISTEQRNAATMHIDEASTAEIVRLMNQEDQKVAVAVEQVLPNVAAAVDVIYNAVRGGGRLIYCGCGTSGRLGILDAVECLPTFGADTSMVDAVIAGGQGAFVRAVEGAEDDPALGQTDLEALHFSAKDVLVGIAASGRTPYVLGAMRYAKSLGAPVVSVTCCPGSEVDALADIGIAPEPGPEVITGSTRLKSGTAQKMVLNMLSTATMIKLGKVYGNLMVDVKATNEKLVERCVRIVRTATGAADADARAALEQCSYSAKTAILMLLCHLDAAAAEQCLAAHDGRIAAAVQAAQ